MALTPLQWSVVNHMVAYELSPKDNRLSHNEFGEMVGISPRSIINYMSDAWECPTCGFKRKQQGMPRTNCMKCGKVVWVNTGPAYPEFMSALNAALEEAKKTNDFFSLRTRQWALEEMVRLYHDKKTTDTNKRHILMAIRDQTVDAVPVRKLTDFDSMPDEELERLILGELTDAEKAYVATITKELPCSPESPLPSSSAQPSPEDSSLVGA